ncbi:MAG: hypothetical protein VX294_13160 [Candidatus Latescibacterota bacterium]|nr:hypothetical protein [Candidatus Latescibacterota bacterium]
MGCGMFHMPNFCAMAHSGGNSGKELVVIHKSRAYALSSEMSGSPINRGFGISRITSINPKCILVSRQQTLEQNYYRTVMNDLYQTTPQISAHYVLAPELWVEINSFDKWELKRCLKKYSAKAGYARTRTLSKLAAFTAKCTQLLVVSPEKEQMFLETFKTTDLYHFGFGLECLEILDLLGFRDLLALSKLTLRQLTSQFGQEGRRLFEFLTDESTTGIIPNWNPNSISIENTLEENYSESDYERQIVAATEMALNQERMGIVSFEVRLGQGSNEKGMKTLDNPTRDVKKICALGIYLLKRLLQFEERVTKYRMVFNLKELDNVQSDLWGTSDWENLKPTLNRRFPQKFFIPTPIMYTFVPEDANVLRPLDGR